MDIIILTNIEVKIFERCGHNVEVFTDKEIALKKFNEIYSEVLNDYSIDYELLDDIDTKNYKLKHFVGTEGCERVIELQFKNLEG